MGRKIRELFDVARLYVMGTPEEIQESEAGLDEKPYWPVAMTLEAAVGVACIATGMLPLCLLSAPILVDLVARVSDIYEQGNRYTPAGIIGLGRYDPSKEGEKPKQAGGLQLTLWE